MLSWLVWVQSQIYDDISAMLASVAEAPNAGVVWGILPIGIAFGAVHALTPGHSKTVLSAYVLGSGGGYGRALATSLVLSATHIASAVVIAWFSWPLVSKFMGSAGQAPLLEDISRGLLGLIGVWMIYSAFRPHRHSTGEGIGAGLAAGLIPCPLTLFVMSYAILNAIPLAGLAFSAAMLIGVALTLTVFATATVLLRDQFARLLDSSRIEWFSKRVSVLAGGILVVIGLGEVLH